MAGETTPGFRRIGLLRLTWPLLAVTVLTLLAALGNVVVLSIASPELNAAAATANQILGVLYDISVLFSIGALVVIAQLLGAGSLERARRAVIVALRASGLLGLAIGLAVAAAGPAVVALINTPADLADDANAYLWVAAGAMAFNAYAVTATAVLRAYGRTVQILLLGVVVNLLDVPLLALFVLVLDLGAAGAALPSLLVRGIGVLLLAWFVRRYTGVHPFSRIDPAQRRPGGTGAWQMARLSAPSVLENGAYNLVIVTAVSLINLLGTEAINARSYTLTLTALITGVILAIAQGNETLVGWDVGEHALARSRDRTLRTVAWAAAASAGLTLGLWLLAEPALGIFGASEPVVAGARTLLALSVVLLPLSAAATVLYGALRSTGDVVIPAAYSIGSTVLVLLPASWLLVAVAGYGLAGAWWALIAAEAVKAALLLARWLRGSWTRLAGVPDGDPAGQASEVSATAGKSTGTSSAMLM